MNPILLACAIAVSMLAGCASPDMPPPSVDTGADSAIGAPASTPREDTFEGAVLLLVGYNDPTGSGTHDLSVAESDRAFPVEAGATRIRVTTTWADPSGQTRLRLCLPVSGQPFNDTRCVSGPSPLVYAAEDPSALEEGTHVPFITATDAVAGVAGAAVALQVAWKASVGYG